MNKTGNKNPVVIHHVLFALHPAVFYYSININEIYLNDFLSTAAWLAFSALALFFAAALFVKHRAKAAAIVSALFFCSFTGGFAFRALLKSPSALAHAATVRPAVYFFAVSAVLCVAAFLITRSRSSLIEVTKLLNLVAVIAIIMPVYKIGAYYKSNPHLNFYRIPPIQSRPSGVTRNDADPDIYYIIFDRYAGNPALKEYYGHDNSEFFAELRKRGFYVAENSMCNYPGTHMSLSSSLNYRYHRLDPATGERLPRIGADITEYYFMIENNGAARFLKSRGYEYHLAGSQWLGAARSRIADHIHTTGPDRYLNPLASGLFRSNLVFFPYAKIFGAGDAAFRKRLRREIKTLSEDIPPLPEKKFVFAHFLLPHDPMIFKPDGSFYTPTEAAKTTTAERYRNQVLYANSVILGIADSIIKNSKRPAVIIIQGDEGANFNLPGPYGEYGKIDGIVQRNTILNAIRMPGKAAERQRRALHPAITPVNTFRLVFDAYFGAGLDVLPDRSFFPRTNKKHLRVFDNVTPLISKEIVATQQKRERQKTNSAR